MQKILSLTRQAVEYYGMIKSGDVIAVGVSGGKDSLVLLLALNSMKNFYPEKFEIKAISIDAGFDNCDYSEIKKMCESLGIEHFIEKTQIKEIVFDKMDPKSPCAICAKIRRAALCTIAAKHGCNKLALGHNRDDAVETFLMNIVYNGKATCFEPVTHYENVKISIIRPLIFTNEYLIKKISEKNKLPVIGKLCPMDGKTKREEFKNLMKAVKNTCINADKSIFTAIKNLPEFKKYEVKSQSENDG